MPGRIANTQFTGVTAWRGTVTKDNHLYNIFRAKPQMASDIMTVLMSSMYLPTMDTYLSREVPTRSYEDDSELHWDIIASSRRNIPLVEARRCDGSKVDADVSTDPVGVGFEPFFLVTNVDWFALGEIIWGNLNEVYPMIVMEPGRAEGTNVVYQVQLFGADCANGIPVDRLQPGERLSYGYAPIEDNFSRKVGDRLKAAFSQLRNWLFGKSYVASQLIAA